MAWLRNAWYVAAYSRDIPEGQLVARKILGERVVLWRDAGGGVVAVEDRCPHRAAPLSMGRVRDDRLVCGYHGLEFDKTGVCVHNPHGAGTIPGRARVRTYPVEERYGIAWIWTGEEAADPELLPRFAMFDDHDRYRVGHPPWIRMNAPYEYVIDNLLDLSHASYLHDGLLGNVHMIDGADVVTASEGDVVTVTRSVSNKPPPEYFDLLYKADGQPGDVWNDVRWQAPTYVLLDNGCTAPGGAREDGGRIFVAHLLTPETETTTLYHIVAARQLPKGVAVDEARVEARMAELRRIAFTTQDDPMIRAQYENIVSAGDAFQPMNLAIDAGVMLWRGVMKKKLAAEAAGER